MMGQFKGNKIENWSEEKILNILDLQYLSRNACKYLIHNLFVFDWESDYLAITKAGLIHEVEIKISKHDFKNESKNKSAKFALFESRTETTMIPDFFYYCVPENLISVEEVPEYAGLLYVNDYGFLTTPKSAPRLKKEKTDLSKLNLTDKFYFRYLHYLGKYNVAQSENLRLLNKSVERNEDGSILSKTYADLEEEIERLKRENKLLKSQIGNADSRVSMLLESLERKSKKIKDLEEENEAFSDMLQDK